MAFSNVKKEGLCSKFNLNYDSAKNNSFVRYDINKNKTKEKNFGIYLKYAIAFCVFALIILFFSSGNSTQQGVSNGLQMCVNIIIPSMFPFMVICSFLVESGLYEIISKPFGFITKRVLKLPECAGSVFFLSLIGGYPLGGKMVNSLVKDGKITVEQGKRMMYYCVGAGPAFIITAVGVNLIGSFKIGIYLFVSQILSSIIIAVIFGIKTQKSEEVYLTREPKQYSSMSQSLVNAVISSSNALFSICSFVVIFSSLMNLIDKTNILPEISQKLSEILFFSGKDAEFFSAVISGIIEVTQGVVAASRIPGVNGYILTCVFLSFSGFCVMFQIFSTTPDIKISMLPFILSRICHAFMSSVIFIIIYNVFSASVETIALNGLQYKVNLSGSPLACAMLFLLISFLLFSISGNNKNDKSRK